MRKNEPPFLEDAQLLKDAVQLVHSYPKVPLTVDCVIFGFEENKLKVLLIKSDLEIFESRLSLLGDMVNDNEELDDAAYRVLKERTGMNDVFLDQVRAFGHPNRLTDQIRMIVVSHRPTGDLTIEPINHRRRVQRPHQVSI